MKKAIVPTLSAIAVFSMCLLATPTPAQSPQYEVLIIARKPNSSSFPLRNDAGHAWIAIIRNDGDGQWKVDSTYGFWPESNGGPSVNHSVDVDHTNKYLRRESLSRRGQAVRKARISQSRANWIKNGAFREAGCTRYQAIGGIGESCNCADYATRLWHVLTAKWEDFRVRAVTVNLTLDSVVDRINSANRNGDFFDNGNIWQ